MVKRQTTYFPTKIPINTLSGGVGRQASTKRLPSEAEDMDNMFCTTERSIDKRNGFAPLEESGYDLNIPNMESKNLWFSWFFTGPEQRYLIVLDFAGNDTEFMWVYKIDHEENSLVSQIVDNDIPTSIRNYITWGGGQPKDILRSVAVGTSLLILNTKVKAGFTSDGTDNFTFGLDGEKTTEVDIRGRSIEYQTSVTVDPENVAEVWTSATDYIWGQTAIDTADRKSSDTASPDYHRYGIWKVKDSLASTALPGPTIETGSPVRPSEDADNSHWERDTDDDGVTRYTEYVPVEDYVYPDPDKLYLGQAVTKFSELKFPPNANDLTAWNGDTDTRNTILELYPNTGNVQGKGKIVYLSQPYLGSQSGWYRYINVEEKPYLEQVRTPDRMAVLDKDRMPVQIYLDVENDRWSIRTVDWEPRKSGTYKTNPGPSFFQDEEGNAQQKEIKAMSYYRDRLFLASDDTLISSRLGKFDDLFMGDPSNITLTDPIDLKVSSNIYTPITFLKPFRDFLFLGTTGDVQYELMGSENQISPLTAEIAPTSFFPMTEDIEPVTMNNNLFFFAKKRLYIYFGSNSNTAQQAFELSRHVPNYLPNNFYDVAVSSSHNSIFAVANNHPSKTILCYRNQIAQEEIIQNAFFTFTLNDLVHSLETIDDHLYIVSETKDGEEKPKIQLQRISLFPDDPSVPRLDGMRKLNFGSKTYDSSTNKTTINVPISNAYIDQIYVTSPEEIATSILDITVDTEASSDTYTSVTVTGNYENLESGYVGKKFTASATLSKIHLRDELNNAVPGALNLRYGVARHYKSGAYDIKVTRKERSEKVYTFTPSVIGSATTTLDDDIYETDGTFKFPLMGFSDDLKIIVSSSYPYSMNITNLELTGKFKRVPYFLTS